MNRLLVSYAVDFTSFLLQSLTDQEVVHVRDIILFGSAARGTADKDSDIDIFVNSASPALDKRIAFIANRFASSEHARQWHLLGVDNSISCITGRLDDWKELKPSIVANGISLFSKYQSPLKGKTMVILSWDAVKPETRRVALSKKLYGFTYKKRRYAGCCETAGARKLGSNCLSVPLETAQDILRVFRKLKLPVKTIYATIAD